MSSRFTPGFINPLLPGLILGLGLCGAVGVGAVWSQHQVSVLANENRQVEMRLAAIQRESEQLDAEIAEEEDTRVLLARSAHWNLGLAAPAADRIHTVAADPLRHLSAKQGGEGLVRVAERVGDRTLHLAGR